MIEPHCTINIYLLIGIEIQDPTRTSEQCSRFAVLIQKPVSWWLSLACWDVIFDDVLCFLRQTVYTDLMGLINSCLWAEPCKENNLLQSTLMANLTRLVLSNPLHKVFPPEELRMRTNFACPNLGPSTLHYKSICNQQPNSISICNIISINI